MTKRKEDGQMMTERTTRVNFQPLRHRMLAVLDDAC